VVLADDLVEGSGAITAGEDGVRHRHLSGIRGREAHRIKGAVDGKAEARPAPRGMV
jgi:hypothetical protein